MPYTLQKEARLKPTLPISRYLQQKYQLPPAITPLQLLESEMPSLAEQRIQTALSEARYLTISQIAELFYAVKADGSPANVQIVRPRPNEEYDTAPGYHSARKMVKAMEARGLVKLHVYSHKQYNKERRDRTVPKLISLASEKGQVSPTNWWHVLEQGQLYVVFHKTGKVTAWHSVWPKQELEDFARQHKLYPDNFLELKDVDCRFPIELDRGKEDWVQLEEKVVKYAGLMQSMPQNLMCPIFLMQPGYRTDLKAAGYKMIEIIRRSGRNQKFLVAPYSFAVDHPLGAVYDDCYTATPRSPLDVERY